MPDLAELVDPTSAALVTSEVQASVVGADAALPELAAAAPPMLAALGRLCRAARAAGVPVIHATAARRADGRGANRNARLFGAMNRSAVAMEPGSDATAPMAELAPDPADLVVERLHGLSPMAGTGLDPVLRNLGAGTVIATGVSVNVAVTNLVMDAVNLGYQVVVPTDAVCGIPAEYSTAVCEHTLAVLATLTTTDELIACWEDR